MILLLTVVCAVLLCAVWIRWSQVRRYWIVRGVPHHPPHPIMGSLTFLQKKNPAIWMREIYNHFKSPYVGMWLFWRPALIINSKELARRVLVKDFDVFRNRLVGSGSAEVDPIGGLNIFTVREPIWSSMRRRLTPVFTSSKLKALHKLFSTKSKELVKRIENDLKENKPSELRSLFADYTTDIIGIAAFGVCSDATLTGVSPMRGVTKDFMHYDTIRGFAWCSIFFFPELVKVFRFTFFPKKSIDYFRKVFRQIVAQRGGYISGAKQNDLLDALRKIKGDADRNKEEMNEDQLVSQAAIFLQAGFDTSASALTYLTYELSCHPDIQDKVYEEILEAKQRIGGEDFDETVLRDLVYFNSAIKETLRKYPALGWLDRVCSRDYQIDDKLTIPAGTTVYVNAVGMHYDEQYYPEPEKFIPERFLPENDDGTRPYMPFGDGPKNCIGMRFANRTVWYSMAEIILKYELRPLPGAKKPSELEVEKKGLFYMPGELLFVKFVPRRKKL